MEGHFKVEEHGSRPRPGDDWGRSWGGGRGKDEGETGGNGETKNTWKVKCSLYGGNSRGRPRFAPRPINLDLFFRVLSASFLPRMCPSSSPSDRLSILSKMVPTCLPRGKRRTRNIVGFSSCQSNGAKPEGLLIDCVWI